MRRSYYNSVGESRLAPAVVAKNGVRHGRGRGVLIVLRQHDIDPARRQHLERAGDGRLGQRVGVHTKKQRTVGAALFTVLADGLADCQHMPLVKTIEKRTAAMSGSAERDALFRDARIGLIAVIRGDQPGNVDQHLARRRFARQGIDSLVTHAWGT